MKRLMLRLAAGVTLGLAGLKLRGRDDRELAELLRRYARQIDPVNVVNVAPGHAVFTDHAWYDQGGSVTE
jgi:hypothetical protein